ncbi:MAG: bifunctional proline dehydrogenase/L-glutamate gamma-semialdehyde dehydrogenase PutA [Alphaproteobacteria bacterium]|nr:MAG: bifunctional proline dehydrogenase/L-glutamate gamma-semialdehyde dehydrogenase PutA [Alphaproteobacteria bacterium]
MATSFKIENYDSIFNDPLRQKMLGYYRADEETVVRQLLPHAKFDAASLEKIKSRTVDLIEVVRQKASERTGLGAFLQTYQLSTGEGIALMCLAEALLRIPDAKTRDKLIRDKIGSGDWGSYTGKSESFFVNASSWGLLLTGRVVNLRKTTAPMISALGHAVARLGEPVIRAAVEQVMQVMGQQFVMGETIAEALHRAEIGDNRMYRYSYDMLGEAAKTAKDAERYFDAYRRGIEAVGAAAKGRGPIAGPGISVKLSALHPRYEFTQRTRVLREMTEKLVELCSAAKRHNINLCIDAEESERLDLSFDVIERAFSSRELQGWYGFGLALQAYSKRAYSAIDWLAELSRRNDRLMMLRLVKGAYWDAEVKRSQERGLPAYEVFTRKATTDMSYLACARKILGCGDGVFYPQFGTHNAYTVSAILELAGNRDFEFQRLHGMADELYGEVCGPHYKKNCRVYAPVGSHEDLLAYLVRRLLENGANTSFVYKIVDKSVAVQDLAHDPVSYVESLEVKKHPRIPLPKDLLQPERENSMGLDLSNPQNVVQFQTAMQKFRAEKYYAGPIVSGQKLLTAPSSPIVNPANNDDIVGYCSNASLDHVRQALQAAKRACASWGATPVEKRAACLEVMARKLEQNRDKLMTLLIAEGGKTWNDALGEVREAVDFCYYYAANAKREFTPRPLLGPTGESNQLSLHGRGVFVCISPWNFPLAIFLGQITAALVAGNCVIAKPAEQTPLIAALAAELLHQSGIPADVLHLIPGPGETIGAALTGSALIDGVAFTGGTDTARLINKSLSERNHGAIVPFIAETGGQNAMIVDSSALPEQVVNDVITSSFQSAGQRCSALRVLYLQDDTYDKILNMLIGASKELVIGNPANFNTDIGPQIDKEACDSLRAHRDQFQQQGRVLFTAELPADCKNGSFFAPTVVKLDSISQLDREYFGPFLHLIRYKSEDLGRICDDINNTGFGLTFGVHSRIQETIDFITNRVQAGNVYVNRNMIGAVVGSQPFGGMGLSGTGPKAGGPNYLHRFAFEKTVTVDLTASGGNATLLNLSEEKIAND